MHWPTVVLLVFLGLWDTTLYYHQVFHSTYGHKEAALAFTLQRQTWTDPTIANKRSFDLLMKQACGSKFGNGFWTLFADTCGSSRRWESTWTHKATIASASVAPFQSINALLPHNFTVGQSVRIGSGRYEGCFGTVLDVAFDEKEENYRVLLVRDCRPTDGGPMHYLHPMGHGKSAWYSVDVLSNVIASPHGCLEANHSKMDPRPSVEPFLSLKQRTGSPSHKYRRPSELIACRSPSEIFRFLGLHKESVALPKTLPTFQICDALIRMSKLLSKLTEVDQLTPEMNPRRLITDSRFVTLIHTLEERVKERDVNRYIDYAWLPWSFAKLRLMESPIHSARVTEILKLLTQSAVRSPPFEALHHSGLSALVWGFSKCNVTAPAFWDAVQEAVIRRSTNLSPQDIANILSSFARLNIFSKILFDTLALEAIKRIQGFTMQGLSNILWSFGRCRYSHFELFRLIDGQFVQRRRALNAMSITLIIGSYSRLNYTNQQLFLILDESILQNIQYFEPQQLVQILWALSKHSSHRFESGITALCAELVSTLPKLNVKQLSLTLWSLAKLKKLDTTLLQLYKEEILKRNVSAFSPIDFTMICDACALSDLLDIQLIQYMLHLAKQQIHRMESLYLVWFMEALASLGVKDASFLDCVILCNRKRFPAFSLDHMASLVSSLLHLYPEVLHLAHGNVMKEDYLEIAYNKVSFALSNSSPFERGISFSAVFTLLNIFITTNLPNRPLLLTPLFGCLQRHSSKLRANDWMTLNTILTKLGLADDKEWKTLLASLSKQNKQLAAVPYNRNAYVSNRIPRDVDAADYIDLS